MSTIPAVGAVGAAHRALAHDRHARRRSGRRDGVTCSAPRNTSDSPNPQVRAVADLLATGDLRRVPAPSLPPHTHWYNWPDSGRCSRARPTLQATLNINTTTGP
ncbi:hypothetical protein E1193_09655 [Micromonospora sp. KC606]|nr:hypothetical protein E1193_09655 [Micromonospora sp. KC606]